MKVETIAISVDGKKRHIDKSKFNPEKHIKWLDAPEPAELLDVPEAKQATEDVNFEEMTVRDLRDYLLENNYGTIPSSWRKDDLIAEAVRIYRAKHSYI